MTYKAACERGITLIELIVVVVIIALISSVAGVRLGLVGIAREKEGIRTFVNTWEFLYGEALRRREPYRLIIDLDDQQYYVQRELPVRQDAAQQVDLLAGFKEKSHAHQKQKEKEAKEHDISSEYEAEDLRQGEVLELGFIQAVYADPYGEVKLGTPLAFPTLAEKRGFPGDLRLRDLQIGNDVITNGEVFLRFSPLGGTEFTVAHLDVAGSIYTAVMNPSTGTVQVTAGDIQYESALHKKEN